MAGESAELPQELAALGFEDVRVARVQPGDVIVLMTSKQITAEEAEIMHEQLSALFGGYRVAVLQDGLFLEVLRPAQPAPTEIHVDFTADHPVFMDELRKHIRMRGYGYGGSP